MLFIALAKLKTALSKEVVVQNLRDIEAETKGEVRYPGIYWTIGRYDTVAIFEAPDEMVAMNLALTNRREVPLRKLGDESRHPPPDTFMVHGVEV